MVCTRGDERNPPGLYDAMHVHVHVHVCGVVYGRTVVVVHGPLEAHA